MTTENEMDDCHEDLARLANAAREFLGTLGVADNQGKRTVAIPSEERFWRAYDALKREVDLY